MTAATQFDGVFHFPSQAGRIPNRNKFLDGTYKTYWGSGNQNTNSTTYVAPEAWPAAGKPALIPRVVRYYPASNTPGGQFDSVGVAVDSYVTTGMTNGSWTNLYTNKRIAAGIRFPANGNNLLICSPKLTDLAANNYYATDILNVWIVSNVATPGRYYTPGFISGTINLANITADANSINLTGDQSPRYQTIVLLHNVYSPPFPPGAIGAVETNSINDHLTIYQSLFAGLINVDYYTFLGVVNTLDPVVSIANNINAFIQAHYGL